MGYNLSYTSYKYSSIDISSSKIKKNEKLIAEMNPMRDLSYTNSYGKRFLETGAYFVMVNDQKVKFEIVE